MDFRSSRWFWASFLFGGAFFFLGSLTLALAGGGSVFVSPDETANAFFAKHFSETGSLRVLDPLTNEFDDTLFPRSVVAVDGELVPQSFLGLLVLYGTAVYFFGPGILLILTPLVVIAAALALRKLLHHFFSSHIADLSTLLFLFHPAIWYYSARGLMHNVFFICLLILAACHFFCRPITEHLMRCEKRYGHLLRFQETIDSSLCGFLIGLALFVRTSEMGWVALVIFVLILTSLRSIRSKEIGYLFIGILIGFLPFFFFNQATYGHPLVTGYTVSDSVGAVRTAMETSTTSNPLFPFGIDLKAAGKHMAQYGVLLFWWLSALALLGFPLCAYKQKKYALVFVLVAVWLGVSYGSWTFFDNPDPTQITIANSYVRYGLPAFILSLPFVAQGIIWLCARTRSPVAARLAMGAILFFVIGLSVRIVFFEGQDALTRVAQTLRESQDVKVDVLSITPDNSVIIVDRADKLFFPDRHVRYPLRSDETYAQMPQIASRVPLYYYGITLPQKDLDYLNTSKLKTLGLQIEYVKTYHEESLYRIYRP